VVTGSIFEVIGKRSVTPYVQRSADLLDTTIIRNGMWVQILILILIRAFDLQIMRAETNLLPLLSKNLEWKPFEERRNGTHNFDNPICNKRKQT
jgi:hypothetical protein